MFDFFKFNTESNLKKNGSEYEDIVVKENTCECNWKDTIKIPCLNMYQESAYLHKKNTAVAWDKIFRNSNRIRLICPENLMSGIAYQQITEEKNGIKVVVEFPTHSEQTDILRQEIKSVLSCVLREQLQKIS